MNIRQRNHFSIYYLFILSLLTTLLQAEERADQNDDAIGVDIMHEVYKRHQRLTFIYEEQSMVMMDRDGNRDTKKIRRYSRVEDDGSVKFLLLFDSPDEINGVAILANRDVSGNTEKYIYLPGFGEKLIENIGSGRDGKFLGTDFSIENLAGESLENYIYIRKADKKTNNTEYFVIDVYNKEDVMDEVKPDERDRVNRRHFISKNNYYITKTEYFDRQGKVFKTLSYHDLKPVDKLMWRANMILMEDNKEHHQSLIKINRRVFSRDYVSADIFTAEWLFKNSPYIGSFKPDEEVILSEHGDEEVITNINQQENINANEEKLNLQ